MANTKDIEDLDSTQQSRVRDAIGAPALGETSSDAHRGDHGKAAYDHSQNLAGAHVDIASDEWAIPFVDTLTRLRLFGGFRRNGTFHCHKQTWGTTPDEIVALQTRTSKALRSDGHLAIDSWGAWHLRRLRQKLGKWRAGETTYPKIAMIGDSWTHGRYRIAQPLRRMLKSVIGDSGAGWCGLSWPAGQNGAADDADVLYPDQSTVDGANWTSYQGPLAYGPDAGHIVAAADGAYVEASVLVAQDVAEIHYRQTPGGGSFRYTTNGGSSWTTVSTDGNEGVAIHTTGAIPVSTLRIEAIHAGVALTGVHFRKNQTGIRISKLGRTGGLASDFAALDDAYFLPSLTSIAPDAVSIMFGTNEQSGNVSVEAYKTALAGIISKVRLAVPYCDIILLFPGPNNRTAPSITLEEYKAGMFEVAYNNNCAWLDFERVFGAYDEVKDGELGYFASDGIHPDADGGYLMSHALFSFIQGS